MSRVSTIICCIIIIILISSFIFFEMKIVPMISAMITMIGASDVDSSPFYRNANYLRRIFYFGMPLLLIILGVGMKKFNSPKKDSFILGACLIGVFMLFLQSMYLIEFVSRGAILQNVMGQRK